MEKNEFDELLKRIPEIAEAVNKFSSSELQEKAFQALMKVAGLADAIVTDEPVPPKAPPKRTPTAKQRAARPESRDKKSKRRESEKYELVDIDFHPESKPSLKEFYAQKAPKSDPEKYVCIVYYIKHFLGIDGITKDHIYTAFKELRVRVPNIKKGLNNTRGRHSWIAFSRQNPISLTRIGENFVEHELPRKEDKESQ